MVSSGKLDKYEMKNPKKGVSIQIRASSDTEKNIDYVTFHFFRGSDVKIKTSLVKTSEYLALFGYFKNLLDNYNTVCATALLRNDIYFEFFMKGKEGAKNNSAPQGKKESTNKSNNQSGNHQTNKKPNPKDYQSQIDDEMSNMGNVGNSSGEIDFGDDVPF